MRIAEIFEARSHAAQNPKLSVFEWISQYKDNPRAYLHMAPIPKVGIYPKATDGHDSPLGVYAYRIMDVYKNDIERWNTGEYSGKNARGLGFLPYHGGDHLFILESDIDPHFVDTYSIKDLSADIDKLKALYNVSDEDMKMLQGAARTNLNFRKERLAPSMLWGITKALVAGVSEFDEYTPVDTKKWNAVLRKLGYVGFNDTGYGVIHGAEDSQAVFLTAAAFKVVDHMNKNMRQKEIEIAGKKYKGGRIPKNLVMDGIPNTFFYNNKPKDFIGVQTWTVKGIEVRDFTTFCHFLPHNATGIVEKVVIGSSDVFSYVQDMRKWMADPQIPPNVKIKSLAVGGRDPIGKYLRKIEDFPSENILISKYADTYGFDKMSPAVQAKVMTWG